MARKIIDYDPGFAPWEQKEIDDQEAVIEKQKAWLKEQYDKREQERISKQKRQEDLAKKETSAQETEKLEEKAEEIKKYYALDYFMQGFNRTSFYNELFGQGLFHVVLGQALANKKLSLDDSSNLDWRLNFLLIQDSSSGKGKGVNFIIKIFNHPKFKKQEHGMKRDYHIHKLGRMNPASLINTYITDKNGKIKKDDLGNPIVKYGIIEQYDVIYAEEARIVLQDTDEALTLQEIIMTAVEPIGSTSNIYEKQLTDYEEACQTKSTASFVLTTRPFGKMKKTMAESGLLQRFIFLPRERIPKDIMDKMLEASIFSFKRKQDSSDFERNFDILIAELNKVVNFASKTDIDFCPDHIDELLSFTHEKIKWFSEQVYIATMSDGSRRIMESIIRRYKDNLMVMAAHSSAMRFSEKIEKEDLQYAFDFFKKVFEMQMDWITKNVVDDKDTTKEQKDIMKDIERELGRQQNKSMKLPDLISYIARKHRKTYANASYYVKQYGPERSEFPLYALENSKKDKRTKIAVLI